MLQKLVFGIVVVVVLVVALRYVMPETFSALLDGIQQLFTGARRDAGV